MAHSYEDAPILESSLIFVRNRDEQVLMYIYNSLSLSLYIYIYIHIYI